MSGRVLLEDREDMECWEDLGPILQKFADELDLQIRVSVPHAHPYQIEGDEGQLCIRFWSWPTEFDRTRARFTSVFGYELSDGQRDANEPVDISRYEDGYAWDICDDTDGKVVAQVFDNTMFVLFDLPHRGGSNTRNIMRRIMEKYAEGRCSDNPEERQRRREQRARERREEMQQRFANLYFGTMRQRVEQAVERADARDDEIRQQQRTLIRLVRDREDAIAQKVMLETLFEERDQTKPATVFDGLAALAVDGDVRVTSDYFEVPVGQIDIEYAGVVYDIGKFNVRIYPSGHYGGVACVNTTRVVEGRYHPHIRSDGEVCLGNMAEAVPKLIALGEYVQVVELMIQFLESVNPGGWYARITCWPVKETE